MPSSRYYRLKTVKSEEKTKKREMIIFWSFFGIAFFSIAWSFLMSPFFKITEIKLPENNFITGNDIKRLISSSIPLNLGENLILLPKNKIKSDLTAAFPAITNIDIKKELFHDLIINFEKRIQIGIWCHPVGGRPEGDNCYYIDKEGVIFKEAPLTEGALILKIKDFEKKEISLGDQVLNNDRLKFITEFNNKIVEKNRFKIMEFKIRFSENFDLEAVTDRGWSIYLDQKQDPALEANNLFTILSEAIKTNDTKLEYVDLRIPSRIFYKLK